MTESRKQIIAALSGVLSGLQGGSGDFTDADAQQLVKALREAAPAAAKQVINAENAEQAKALEEQARMAEAARAATLQALEEARAEAAKSTAAAMAAHAQLEAMRERLQQDKEQSGETEKRVTTGVAQRWAAAVASAQERTDAATVAAICDAAPMLRAVASREEAADALGRIHSAWAVATAHVFAQVVTDGAQQRFQDRVTPGGADWRANAKVADAAGRTLYGASQLPAGVARDAANDAAWTLATVAIVTQQGVVVERAADVLEMLMRRTEAERVGGLLAATLQAFQATGVQVPTAAAQQLGQIQALEMSRRQQADAAQRRASAVRFVASPDVECVRAVVDAVAAL